MDKNRNEFVEWPEDNKKTDHLISFNLNEIVTVKGYLFTVHRIYIDSNYMILKPKGKPQQPNGESEND